MSFLFQKVNRIWNNKGNNYPLLFAKWAIAGLVRLLIPSEDGKRLHIRLTPSSWPPRVDTIPGGSHVQSYPLAMSLWSCFRLILLEKWQSPGGCKFSQPTLCPSTSWAFSSDTKSKAHHLLQVRRSRPSSCRLWWMQVKWRNLHAESSGGKQKQRIKVLGPTTRVSRCCAQPRISGGNCTHHQGEIGLNTREGRFLDYSVRTTSPPALLPNNRRH